MLLSDCKRLTFAQGFRLSSYPVRVEDSPETNLPPPPWRRTINFPSWENTCYDDQPTRPVHCAHANLLLQYETEGIRFNVNTTVEHYGNAFVHKVGQEAKLSLG